MPVDTSTNHHYPFRNEPVAIGGVGGSGTRLIAAILESTGYCMGSDRNPANDNLAFTLLFKQGGLWPLSDNLPRIRDHIRIFLQTQYFRQALDDEDILTVQALADTARLNAPREWLRQRAGALIQFPENGQKPDLWGWKEPNTHIFLPVLLERIPGLRYIHVMRHGLDMAYSANQAQVQFWGEALTGFPTTSSSPQESFRYWCAAHKRILNIGAEMGSRFLLINFDEFCAHPQSGLVNLLQFLNIEANEQQYQKLLGMIKKPASIGRHKGEAKLALPAQDITLLRELGFDYSW